MGTLQGRRQRKNRSVGRLCCGARSRCTVCDRAASSDDRHCQSSGCHYQSCCTMGASSPATAQCGQAPDHWKEVYHEQRSHCSSCYQWKAAGIRNCDVVAQQPAAGHQVPLSAELVATGWHVRPGTTQLLCCPKRHKDAIAYQQANAQGHKQS